MAEEPGAGGVPPEEDEDEPVEGDAENVENAPEPESDAEVSDGPRSDADSDSDSAADASPITGRAPDARQDSDANPITGRAPDSGSDSDSEEVGERDEADGSDEKPDEADGSEDEPDEGAPEPEPQLRKKEDYDGDERRIGPEEPKPPLRRNEGSDEEARRVGPEEPKPPLRRNEGSDEDESRTARDEDGKEASVGETVEEDEDGSEEKDEEEGEEEDVGLALEELAAEGPPDDEEMPLADHIEEMIKRLAIVCAVAGVVATGVFFIQQPGPARALSQEMIMFIWNSVLPDDQAADPRVYGPLELKLTELKFASLVGFIAALPMFVYQTYRFMRPGLYPNERRYYLAAIPTSLVLAFIGVAFAFYVLLPVLFQFFMEYSEAAGTISFALQKTFDLILILMGYLALVFQIPLFIMLAIMMGLTTREWLEDKRLYFWAAFLGISFLVLPEPTGMAPLMATITMIFLYEGTLALLRWTGN